MQRLNSFFDSDDLAGAYFLDSALNYQGPVATQFSGLAHLSGREVRAFTDGGTADDLRVDEKGSPALPWPAASVHVGLPYTLRLVHNLPEFQTRQGSRMMRNRKITAVRLRAYRSMSFLAGLEGSLAPIADRHIRAGAYKTPNDRSSSRHLFDTSKRSSMGLRTGIIIECILGGYPC